MYVVCHHAGRYANELDVDSGGSTPHGFLLRNPRPGPNMSSAIAMFRRLTGQFGSRFFLKIDIKEHVLGRPIISWVF
jgi:hypothetical protein